MMDIGIAVINRMDLLTSCIKSIEDTTGFDYRLTLLDNASSDEAGMRVFAETKNMQYIRNQRNLGIYASYNQIYKATHNDWVAFMHNDVIIHEKNWDIRVMQSIKEIEKAFGKRIGIVGFAGSRGGDIIGARMDFMSNLRAFEGSHGAELHGRRMTICEPAIFLDGAVLICRREMLDKVSGFDERYMCHHIYDYDISMESIAAGYCNMVVGIDFSHRGGETACNNEGQLSFDWWAENNENLRGFIEQQKVWRPEITAEQAIMDYNINRFRFKWSHKLLPCTTDCGYNYIKGRVYRR